MYRQHSCRRCVDVSPCRRRGGHSSGRTADVMCLYGKTRQAGPFRCSAAGPLARADPDSALAHTGFTNRQYHRQLSSTMSSSAHRRSCNADTGTPQNSKRDQRGRDQSGTMSLVRNRAHDITTVTDAFWQQAPCPSKCGPHLRLCLYSVILPHEGILLFVSFLSVLAHPTLAPGAVPACSGPALLPSKANRSCRDNPAS